MLFRRTAEGIKIAPHSSCLDCCIRPGVPMFVNGGDRAEIQYRRRYAELDMG